MLPTRAPRRGPRVDSRTLGWRSRGLCCRPLFHLLLGDSLRLPLGDFLSSFRLHLHARVARRHFSAWGRRHWSPVIIRPLGHRRTLRPSGLVTAKRDAARLAGSNTHCLPLLSGQLIYRCPLPLDFLQNQGGTLRPTCVRASGLRQGAGSTFLRLSCWPGIHCLRPIAPQHTREVRRSFLQMDLSTSELVYFSAMVQDKKGLRTNN